MDVNFFLKERTNFICQLYRVTSAPYIERIQKIQNKEKPFVPLCEIDQYNGEPPFQKEFNEAVESLDTLRLMYISMLSSALHESLKTWTKITGKPLDPQLHPRPYEKKGWFWNYGSHFKHYFNIDFTKAPIDLKIIEEIVLARNNIEHQASIASRPKYGVKDYEYLQSLSYIDEFSAHLTQELGFCTIFSPSVYITEEQLLTALSTIDKFSEWLNNELEDLLYPLRAKQCNSSP
jgi:hypothetical protein